MIHSEIVMNMGDEVCLLVNDLSVKIIFLSRIKDYSKNIKLGFDAPKEIKIMRDDAKTLRR